MFHGKPTSSGVSSHVSRQGSAAPASPVERSAEDLADYRRRRELRRFHPHNLADDSEVPLPAHAAGEPVPERTEAAALDQPRRLDDDEPTLAQLGVAALFAAIAAIIFIWLVYLPVVGALYLAGWL